MCRAQISVNEKINLKELVSFLWDRFLSSTLDTTDQRILHNVIADQWVCSHQHP